MEASFIQELREYELQWCKTSNSSSFDFAQPAVSRRRLVGTGQLRFLMGSYYLNLAFERSGLHIFVFFCVLPK